MTLTKMTNDELRAYTNDCFAQIAQAQKELTSYKVIECTVCQLSDIVYRGEELPFVTWSNPSGHPLCPHCTGRFKHGLPAHLTVSVADEIMALID